MYSVLVEERGEEDTGSKRYLIYLRHQVCHCQYDVTEEVVKATVRSHRRWFDTGIYIGSISNSLASTMQLTCDL